MCWHALVSLCVRACRLYIGSVPDSASWGPLTQRSYKLVVLHVLCRCIADLDAPRAAREREDRNGVAGGDTPRGTRKNSQRVRCASLSNCHDCSALHCVGGAVVDSMLPLLALFMCHFVRTSYRTECCRWIGLIRRLRGPVATVSPHVLVSWPLSALCGERQGASNGSRGPDGTSRPIGGARSGHAAGQNGAGGACRPCQIGPLLPLSCPPTVPGLLTRPRRLCLAGRPEVPLCVASSGADPSPASGGNGAQAPHPASSPGKPAARPRQPSRRGQSPPPPRRQLGGNQLTRAVSAAQTPDAVLQLTVRHLSCAVMPIDMVWEGRFPRARTSPHLPNLANN